jgi:hypothetical protein
MFDKKAALGEELVSYRPRKKRTRGVKSDSLLPLAQLIGHQASWSGLITQETLTAFYTEICTSRDEKGAQPAALNENTTFEGNHGPTDTGTVRIWWS